MAFTNIGQVLNTHPRSISTHRGKKAYPTTSDKPWARHELKDWTPMSTNPASFVAAFNPDVIGHQRLHLPLTASKRVQEVTTTESGVATVWETLIEYPTRQAFGDEPALRFKTQEKTDDSPGRIDRQWGFLGIDKYLVVGEDKRPFLINQQAWVDNQEPGSSTYKLARELLSYAIANKCPIITCFDGIMLLILRFEDKYPDYGKTTEKTKCWVLDTNPPPGVSQIPAPLAFYIALATRLDQVIANAEAVVAARFDAQYGGQTEEERRPYRERSLALYKQTREPILGHTIDDMTALIGWAVTLNENVIPTSWL